MTDINEFLLNCENGFLRSFSVYDQYRLTPIEYLGLPRISKPNEVVLAYTTASSFENQFNIKANRFIKSMPLFLNTLNLSRNTYTGFGISVFNRIKLQILNYERVVNLLPVIMDLSSRTYLGAQ